jgi:Xaa-Pro aminopeptidase
VIDFGCRYQGYCSDQTRTLCRNPGGKVEEVHSLVLEAQQAALERVEPGVKASEVDRAAREVIESSGFGDEFVHSTGHGVGIEVHESPSVSKNSHDALEEGMAITVEPGIYLEEEFGVRIENLVLVTGDGYENLNSTSKKLN